MTELSRRTFLEIAGITLGLSLVGGLAVDRINNNIELLSTQDDLFENLDKLAEVKRASTDQLRRAADMLLLQAIDPYTSEYDAISINPEMKSLQAHATVVDRGFKSKGFSIHAYSGYVNSPEGELALPLQVDLWGEPHKPVLSDTNQFPVMPSFFMQAQSVPGESYIFEGFTTQRTFEVEMDLVDNGKLSVSSFDLFSIDLVPDGDVMGNRHVARKIDPDGITKYAIVDVLDPSYTTGLVHTYNSKGQFVHSEFGEFDPDLNLHRNVVPELALPGFDPGIDVKLFYEGVKSSFQPYN